MEKQKKRLGRKKKGWKGRNNRFKEGISGKEKRVLGWCSVAF
jgi:hypothetical protein